MNGLPSPLDLGYGIFGLAVKVDIYLCDRRFTRWVRTHRKKRIAKKWHRKYGAICVCTGRAHEIAGTLYCCPCFFAKLESHPDLGGSLERGNGILAGQVPQAVAEREG